MIDRNSPVTEDELHAYVDGELAGRPPRRRRGLAREPSRRCRPRRRMARAGGRHPRALRRARREPVPARFDLDRLTRSRRSWRAVAAAAVIAAFLAGGVAGWMAHGASAAAPDRIRNLHHARRSARTGSTSPRCATRSRCAPASSTWCRGCRGGSAPRCGRPTSTPFSLKLLGGRLLPGPDRSGGVVHVRGPDGRALHVLLLARRSAADGVALHHRRPGRRRALGRERDRLRGERPGRPRAAVADRAGRLRADREPRRRRAARPVA